MSAMQLTGGLRPLLWPVVGLRTWSTTGYLFLAPIVGTFWLVLLITGFSLGAGLLIIWVGLPILVVTVALGRLGARIERRLVHAALGEDVGDPYRRPTQGSVWARLRVRATDPATWRDLTYLVLLTPLGVVWAVLVSVLWAVPFGLATMPVWYRLPEGGQAPLRIIEGDPLVVIDSLPEALLGMVLGLALAVLAAHAVLGLGRAHAAVARGLLGPTQAVLARRVQALEVTRARAMDAAAAERRRIERDLHDGAQARLVALAMDLGMAREKFASEPEAARALVEEAHREAKLALAELRDLARGIHPAVLTDRGLDAALSALAARSPVPVEVVLELDGRLPEAAEVIAYYVVAEALVNVAKHAEASEATVRVWREGRAAIVEISDDGRGGADADAGSGLRGLADRLGGIDGRLTVSSPRGGPTVVRAELPLPS
jgi:signal transduction histidine kinase